MDTTVGQILINQMLPRDMQDHDRVLDKKNVKKIFTELAERYPDRYSEINQKFHALAQETNTTHGGQASLSLDSLKAPDSVVQQRDVVRAAVDKILASDIPEKRKNEEIIKTIVGSIDSIEKSNYDDALRDGNPMALQVFSGARGNKSQLRSTTAGDMLVVDHKDRPIPIPILSSYAEGLDPVQYWAGTYGARKGALSTKFATPKSGFLGKQLAMAAHRIMVTEKDCGTQNHITVDTSDGDSAGAVLANDAGQFKAGTVLTPRMLKSMGDQKIQIRSPLTCQSHAGICQRCAGVRERGGFPPIGDNVGIAAAQAIAEPIGQGQLCLAKGTMVRMADWSKKPIEHVQPSDMILGADTSGATFPVKVVQRFDNGRRDCVCTNYHLGKTKSKKISLVSTAEHKVLSEFEFWRDGAWRYTSGLYPAAHQGRPGGYSRAVPPISFIASGLKPEPRAMLIGLLLGDGCYVDSVKNVHFSCADPLLIDDMQQMMQPFNLKLTHLNEYYYYVSSIVDKRVEWTGDPQIVPRYRNPAKLMLHELGLWGKYAHEKTIPDSAYFWDNDSVAQLIAGLFVTDGSAFRNGPYTHLSYASTSQRMAQQVAELLEWRFGIFSCMYTQFGKNRKRPLYSISITGDYGVRRFQEMIPLIGIKKYTLTNLLSTQDVRRDTRYRWTRDNIEPAGELETFDIEVDHPDHLFVLANGLIVSNSAKHGGGVAGNKSTKSGMDLVNQLVQVPSEFKGGAAIAQADGKVSRVEDAPQGGKYVYVGDAQHWMPADQALKVKMGDTVEAGDVLSDGIPNPALIVQHKGIGDGRRYFVDQMHQTLKDGGFEAHRRNIELLARGLINHVRVTDLYGPNHSIMDDVIEYDSMAPHYEPRAGTVSYRPNQAVGKYLERPAAHYSIGTRITPRVANTLKDAKILSVDAHDEPPSFAPEMTRAMETLSHSDDWMVRMGGFGLKKGLMESVHRNRSSDLHGTSFIPALAQGTEFGKPPPGVAGY